MLILIYRFAQANPGVEGPVSNAFQCGGLGIPRGQNVDCALQSAREVLEPSGYLMQKHTRGRLEGDPASPVRRHGTTLIRFSACCFRKGVTFHLECDNRSATLNLTPAGAWRTLETAAVPR